MRPTIQSCVVAWLFCGRLGRFGLAIGFVFAAGFGGVIGRRRVFYRIILWFFVFTHCLLLTASLIGFCALCSEA